ncbi:MAG: glycosyltransferase family 39 protein [Patescibacteria group bacterium]
MSSNKNFLVLFILIFFCFILLRFLNLGVFPIFNDEAIYLNWAKAIHNNWTEFKYISIFDGKPPLHYWLLAPFLKLFSDPLIAGRFLSGIFGIFSFFGIFLISKTLFKSKKIILLSIFLYTISPFGLFYERMALMEALLLALAIYLFYFSWLLYKTRKIILIFPLAVINFLGIFSKQNFLILTISMAIGLILSILKREQNKNKERFFLTLKFSLAIFLSAILYLIFMPQGAKDYLSYRVVATMVESNNFFGVFFGNLKIIFSILSTYLPFSIGIFLIFIFLERGFWKKDEIKWLLVWAFFPLFIFAFISRSVISRYFVFVLPFFIILISFSICKLFSFLKEKKFLFSIYLLSFILAICLPLKEDVILLSNPKNFNWAEQEKGWINSWASGYAISELGDYLKINAKEGDILFLNSGLGYPRDFFQLYSDSFPKMKYVDLNENFMEDLKLVKKDNPQVPCFAILMPDRHPFYQELESADICKNKKIFYQPDGINHYTLCFF